MSQKFSVNEFAEHLSAAVNVGEKIDAIALRLDELSQKVDRLLADRPPARDSDTSILHSIPEAAEMLSMHPQTLRKRIASGDLRVVKHGKMWRVRHRDLEAFANKDLGNLWTSPREPRTRQ